MMRVTVIRRQMDRASSRRADPSQSKRSGFFFFSSRRRHTRLQGDWSSDVCSSDLQAGIGAEDQKVHEVRESGTVLVAAALDAAVEIERGAEIAADRREPHQRPEQHQIGRASCRGKGEISVVGGSFKKKKKKTTIQW